jgi:hypothetical protein
MALKKVFMNKSIVVLFAVLALTYIAPVAWHHLGEYPFLYGPGDIDVVVKSMVIDASENVLIGGQSKFIQTEGEGFVMLVDIYGVAAFANTYASGATGGDEVHKVALQGDGSTFTAVGTSISIGEGAHNTHFFLILTIPEVQV